MARYTASAAEITSIADAIRAKTNDNSPLVFPTGFVSAINGISINNEPLYSTTLAEETITLADTNFANWDSSSSNFLLYDSTTLNSFRRDMTNKTGAIICQGYTKYAYTTEIPNNSGIWLGYIAITYCTPRAHSIQGLINRNHEYIGAANFSNTISLLYKDSNGNINETPNAYGILVLAQAISTGSNTNPSNFQITPKTPIIRITTNSSYVNTESFSYIDPQNTIIYYKLIYEEYPDNQLINRIYNNIEDLYIQSNSN